MANNLPNGRFAVVDTVLSKTDATIIDALSGTQGDGGRIVNFALKDGSFAHNLDGQDVSLQVKDAAGKVKIVNGIYDRIDVTRGLFSMLIPAEVYQAAGDVEEARLVVTDSKNTVISTIPITFTVFANGVVISANASKDYIDSIQKILDEFNERITTTSNNLETVRTAVNSLNDAITNYTDLVNAKAAAVKTSTNEFTENNTFDKDITVLGAIHGKADNAKQADNALKADSATTAGKADSANTLANSATLNNLSKQHTATVGLLDGTLVLYRYGNTVTAKFNNSGSTLTFSQFKGILPAGSIPAGYRPIDFASLTLDLADWQPDRKAGQVWIYGNGSLMTRSTYNKNTTQSTVISIFGTYQTADDMPEI